LLQVGPMDELLCEPNSEFVARFMRREERLSGLDRENAKVKNQESK
jgi:ABC-type Fe3+/spermidine/putrescine transport system ATPase subunit